MKQPGVGGARGLPGGQRPQEPTRCGFQALRSGPILLSAVVAPRRSAPPEPIKLGGFALLSICESERRHSASR